MSTGTIVLIVVLIILIAALVALFFGEEDGKVRNRLSRRKHRWTMAQTMNMLIIDKKRMKLKEAGLPSVVVENTRSICAERKSQLSKPKSDQRS